MIERSCAKNRGIEKHAGMRRFVRPVGDNPHAVSPTAFCGEFSVKLRFSCPTAAFLICINFARHGVRVRTCNAPPIFTHSNAVGMCVSIIRWFYGQSPEPLHA